MSTIPARDRLIVALDLPGVSEAEAMVARLGDSVSFYKIGLQLVFAGSLPFAERLVKSGKRVFLDVKLLDIDNTVEGAIRSIVAMGMTFVTVHAYPQAMRAAVAARGSAGLKLLGVTVLTSMDDRDVAAAGYDRTVSALVATRAADAKAAGMDGVVVSPAEAAAARAIVGPSMAIVTPGIRPAGADAGDQRRIATPEAAIRAGADYLVVGRPITAAADPKAAAEAVVAEIGRAVVVPA
ncbi:MAG: orotidine-5'-phosphate decarboxylase [Bauldia sp.]|nr:orotidine-5'-phosphate decarboxylase [Bauldia sp.]